MIVARFEILNFIDLPQLIAIGAVMAMLGVLLNLIIGLSRVVLAMGRQGDAAPVFTRLSGDGRAPTGAVILVSLAVGGLALIGSVETTWAFSAFTVLIYYAITNLRRSGLRLRTGFIRTGSRSSN